MGVIAADPYLNQRREALKVANEIRLARSQLKRDLRAGRVRFTDLLVDPPAYVMTAKVIDLLVYVPKYGRVKTPKLLRRLQIGTKTFGDLSLRQRIVLHDAIMRGALQ